MGRARPTLVLLVVLLCCSPDSPLATDRDSGLWAPDALLRQKNAHVKHPLDVVKPVQGGALLAFVLVCMHDRDGKKRWPPFVLPEGR